jgi:hypothetical protein
VKEEAATLPNVTEVAPVKLLPLIVTTVPPGAGPELGLIPLTVGAGGNTKVKWSWEFACEEPEALMTKTSMVPAASAGEVAVIELSDWTEKLAETAPNFTWLAPVKYWP